MKKFELWKSDCARAGARFTGFNPRTLRDATLVIAFDASLMYSSLFDVISWPYVDLTIV